LAGGRGINGSGTYQGKALCPLTSGPFGPTGRGRSALWTPVGERDRATKEQDALAKQPHSGPSATEAGVRTTEILPLRPELWREGGQR
jgi:hypothetical protein